MEYTLLKEGGMPKQQKTYTREFKLEAVQLVKSSGKPMSQIARELGISDSALSRLSPRHFLQVDSKAPLTMPESPLC